MNETYNHAFDLAFEVSGSTCEDSDDSLHSEKELIRAAILRRVESIFATGEYTEALGASFDSFCENDGRIS